MLRMKLMVGNWMRWVFVEVKSSLWLCIGRDSKELIACLDGVNIVA